MKLWRSSLRSRRATAVAIGTANLVSGIDTDPTSVFTTTKIGRGRLPLVDSRFAEPPPQVVALRLCR